MFSEVVKLIPQIDRAALGQMFRTLNQRFASVAKKFGTGLKSAFKFAAVGSGFGLILKVVDSVVGKLVNPLEKAEEVIDRILGKGSDSVDAAEELGSDPGKLLRLEALGKAKGIDSETMRQMLSRFQGALAQEQEKVAAPDRIRAELARETDPGRRAALQTQLEQAQAAKDQGGLLRNFIGETDIAEGLFRFIQSLQRLDKSQQVVVQQDIFGDKMRGKAAAFFNTSPEELTSILQKLPSVDALSAAAKRVDKIGDVADLLASVRETEDFVKKSREVNESQVRALDARARRELDKESKALANFRASATTEEAVDRLTKQFDSFTQTLLNEAVPKLADAAQLIGDVLKEIQPYAKQGVEWLMTTGELAYKKLTDMFTWMQATWGEFKGSSFYKRITSWFGGRD